MRIGIFLLVASAALHAGWNALLKREPDKLASVVAVLGVADLVAVVFSALIGSVQLPAPSLGWTFAAGCCEGGYFVALAYALSRASYGLAYTVSRGGAMFVVWIVSFAWLDERVDSWVLSGVALLSVGLALANSSARASESNSEVRLELGKSAPQKLEQLGASYIAALFIAGYHLAYGRALALGAAPAPLFATALLVALPVVIVSIGRGRARGAWHALMARPLSITASGFLTTASFVMFLTGLSRSGAGLAITIRNTSIIFAQALAWRLGERVSARQLVGAGLVASGAVLVGLPR
jgi:drug/metabolite transporter (DMT)-like permease